MLSLNSAVLSGNLVADPERGVTQGGKQWCRFRLAVNRSWKNSDGERKEEVTFIRVEFWGGAVDPICQYLGKGDTVGVVGELCQSDWTDKEGMRHSMHFIRGEKFIIIKTKDKGTDGQAQQQTEGPAAPEAELPF